jgi:YHS domain-containing protein
VIVLLIRLLFVWFVLRAALRLLRGIAQGLQGPPAPAAPKAVPLARDPVCGTYVVPSTALSAGSGAATRFFCSEDCRRAYVEPQRHVAG